MIATNVQMWQYKKMFDPLCADPLLCVLQQIPLLLDNILFHEMDTAP